ncbi:hypothetical protein AGLY_015235 [Aphis glycines]|uniref:Uncharacterized protein n=1 Tax=Aphis glycines TaxID=307491 RepID=A0A6G0T1W7_APHGL|nr:hypothetical protein AGLY_015235 [Aphis glycines]
MFLSTIQKNQKFQWSINSSKYFENLIFLSYNHIKNRFCRKLVNCIKDIHFTIGNQPRSIILTSYAVHRHEKKTKKNKTHIIVESIHSSLRSESKIKFICNNYIVSINSKFLVIRLDRMILFLCHFCTLYGKSANPCNMQLIMHQDCSVLVTNIFHDRFLTILILSGIMNVGLRSYTIDGTTVKNHDISRMVVDC